MSDVFRHVRQTHKVSAITKLGNMAGATRVFVHHGSNPVERLPFMHAHRADAFE